VLRAVAGDVRAGATPRDALSSAHLNSPVPLAKPLTRLSRRLALGEDIGRALTHTGAAFGDEDEGALGALIAVHEREGGDLAGMLEAFADRIDARNDALRAAFGAGAGAMLSGRLVAGLPLFLLLLAPGTGDSLTDAGGLMMLAIGGGLIAVGMAWMRRLVPKPEAVDDPVATVCDVAACVLSAGTSLNGALAAALRACSPEIRPHFERAHRLARLGVPWPDALAHSGHNDLTALAACVAHARRLGIPLARSLRGWGDARRLERLREFETAVGRAPVLMAIPLTVCVLPAYIVLGLGQVLRGS
jgi:tight adherence protein B